MSENLGLVRSICSAWEAGDYSSAQWATPDIEFVFADGPSPGSFTGVGEMVRIWREYMSAWRDARVDVEGYRTIDCERILVLLDFFGRGRISGVEVGQAHARGANLFELRDGKVARLVLYFDRGHALAELGLER